MDEVKVGDEIYIEGRTTGRQIARVAKMNADVRVGYRTVWCKIHMGLYGMRKYPVRNEVLMKDCIIVDKRARVKE